MHAKIICSDLSVSTALWFKDGTLLVSCPERYPHEGYSEAIIPVILHSALATQQMGAWRDPGKDVAPYLSIESTNISQVHGGHGGHTSSLSCQQGNTSSLRGKAYFATLCPMAKESLVFEEMGCSFTAASLGSTDQHPARGCAFGLTNAPKTKHCSGQ